MFKPRWLVGLIVTFMLYAPIALWLHWSYAPLEEPPGTVFQLSRFLKLSHQHFGYVSLTGRLKYLADTEGGSPRSPLMLYEDGKPLGPAHSSQQDIEDIGMGRFLHLQRLGFFLSTSDNSDPRTNGRTYSVVLPN